MSGIDTSIKANDRNLQNAAAAANTTASAVGTGKEALKQAGGVDIDAYFTEKIFRALSDKDTSVGIRAGRLVDHVVGEKESGE